MLDSDFGSIESDEAPEAAIEQKDDLRHFIFDS